MSQGQREKAMGGFREGKFDILVATDIAARGIDVAGIDYVVNFDVPDTPETYTHRIGRTGRAGASGRAITFVTREDRGWVRATERMLGEKLERFEPPEVDASADALERSDRRGSGRGGASRSGRGRARGSRSGWGAGRRRPAWRRGGSDGAGRSARS